MSIAEKLTTIAKNTPRVYNQGYEDGKSSVSKAFEYATKYNEMYASVIFPENYEITLDCPQVVWFRYLFCWTKNLKKVTLSGNNDNQVLLISHAFRESTELECVDLSELKVRCGDVSYMFYKSAAIKEIKGVLDFTEATNVNAMFNGTNSLEQVRFKANTLSLSMSLPNSSNLSTESINSIIDGLADLTGGTAQTLTLHAAVGAKLTDEQKATITAKNWTLVY